MGGLKNEDWGSWAVLETCPGSGIKSAGWQDLSWENSSYSLIFQSQRSFYLARRSFKDPRLSFF